MTKDVLLKKINEPNFRYDKGKMNSWVMSLPTTTRVKPDKIKKGDVFMHPIFNHPYIFMEKKDGYWLCTLMTSNGDFEEVLEQCKSRFFGDSFITKVLFTVTEPLGSFCGVYDNNRHLSDIATKLKRVII